MKQFRLLSTKKLKPSVVEEASRKGIEVLEKEFIQIAPVNTDEIRNEIRIITSQSATVAFTSRNAVIAAGPVIKNQLIADWTIFCIDGTTLKEVKKYFGDKNIAGTASNAISLASLIIERQQNKEVVFFCGDKRRDELPDTLRKNGFIVKEILVYNTTLMPARSV